MARRVKKTDTREVDHWVSTDDGRHLPIDKDGNIIFGSSKKSTSKSGSNKGKTYSLDKKSDNNYKITNPEKGTSYTVTAKNAEDAARKVHKAQRDGKIDQFDFNEKHVESLQTDSKTSKKKAIDEDKIYEIADRYNSSTPVSGDWNTELDHEIATIQKEFGLSKSEAKDAMKKYLGFTDDDFADDEPTPSSKSKSSSSDKPKSSAPAKELTRKQKVLNDDKVQNLLNTAKGSWGEGVFKDSDGEKFEIGYETDEYYNIYQTSDGQRVDESRVQRMVEGMDSGKYHAWNNQGRLLITSSAKAAVKHAWGTPKEAGLKREAPAATKPTRKTTSSKSNKLKDIFKGEKSSMVEWKINRAYDKTSLKELALEAGVPSSKVRTMSADELRSMLLSMWKGK